MIESAVNDRAALRNLIGQLIIAAAAFVLTAAIWEGVVAKLRARPVIPEPFKTKIDLFLNGPKYDTVFIGSSRFFHGVDPAAFDAQTARRGMPTHSYNLAFDALDFPELRFVVQHLLDDPRAHFKYLVLEPSLRVRLAPGLEHSQRAITLHDAQGSQYVAGFVLQGNHDWKRKLFWLCEQGSVSAIRLTNVGALTNHFIRPQEPPPDLSDITGPAQNGYVPLMARETNAPRVTPQGIQQLVIDQKREELSGEGRRLNDFEISQLTDLQTRAAAHGIKVILLSPPTAAGEMFGEFSAFRLAQQSGALTIPFLSFTDPVKYFDLYDPAGFVDPDHISKPVSLKWTIKAADAFVDLAGGHH